MTKTPTKFKNVFKPVDILIPFYGQYHNLIECLESLITKTLGILYTITIINDCSPNKNFLTTLEKFKLKNAPIQYLNHPERKGFTESLQTGFNNTQNDWVLFLNSDCKIEHTDWLINLLQTMQTKKTEGVKLVSSKMNHGGIGAYDEKVIGTIDKTNDIIATEPLPLVCSLVHRELFKNIGGFLKSYGLFGAEDLELFWRMKLHGFKQAICGSSYVNHIGGATINNAFTWKETQDILDTNENKFAQDIQELNNKIKKS